MNTNTNIQSTTSSLDTYTSTVRSIPVLSIEEEQRLVKRMREDNDQDAARRLVMFNLRYVAHTARKFTGYGVPLEDLIQEGTIGLVHAIERFDPDAGARLITYAGYWIRAHIHKFVLSNMRMSKSVTTKNRRKLFFNLRSFQQDVGAMTEAERRTAADTLDVPLDDVREIDGFLNGRDLSFDAPFTNQAGENLSFAQILPGSQPDPLDTLEEEDTARRRKASLHAALENLDERARDIIAKRVLCEGKVTTLATLAERYGVSAERVRQIEKKSLKKLAGMITKPEDLV